MESAKVSLSLPFTQQHELSALCAELGKVLPYVTREECERAIAVLLPLVSAAVERSLEPVPAELEQKHGRDLVSAIRERRKDAEQLKNIAVTVGTGTAIIAPKTSFDMFPGYFRDEEPPTTAAAASRSAAGGNTSARPEGPGNTPPPSREAAGGNQPAARPEGPGGPELEPFVPRRTYAIGKRDRSSSDEVPIRKQHRPETPVWNYTTHSNITGVTGIGRLTPGGPLGVYVLARPSGTNKLKPEQYFAYKDELAHVDKIQNYKKYWRIHTALVDGIARQFKYMTKNMFDEIADLFDGSDWGNAVLDKWDERKKK